MVIPISVQPCYLKYNDVPVQPRSDLRTCRVKYCPRILSDKGRWVVIKEFINCQICK